MNIDDHLHCEYQWNAYATWTNIEPELRHLVDCSARVLKKVVPSRDITPCRRKEPLMRRLPNGTSCRLTTLTLVRRNLPN